MERIGLYHTSIFKYCSGHSWNTEKERETESVYVREREGSGRKREKGVRHRMRGSSSQRRPTTRPPASFLHGPFLLRLSIHVLPGNYGRVRCGAVRCVHGCESQFLTGGQTADLEPAAWSSGVSKSANDEVFPVRRGKNSPAHIFYILVGCVPQTHI
jgi:hypothetical protein